MYHGEWSGAVVDGSGAGVIWGAAALLWLMRQSRYHKK